ncbi:MAG: PAS domain S-box protein [Dehalococcoidia bacterium]|nr:PAS domain S-box protein [Dehalococcoidia bacterium]
MRQFISGLAGVVRRPGFWLILAILALISIPHYGHLLDHPAFLKSITEQLGLDREAFERILYLAPIIWAGFLFGWRGAMMASLAALALMLPLALMTSAQPRDALFETGAVFVVGNLVAFSSEALTRERQRRSELAALNETCSAASRYLDLGQVLDNSIRSVINVMKVNAAMVFLMNEGNTELALSAHKGISPDFARSVARIQFGEGFNGRVARTGEPLVVADASRDSGLTRPAVCEEGIRSQLIVPLISKGKVLGTLCVATHGYRKFNGHEVELLEAMGNQIGIAVENARLYEQERAVAEQLRQSEERYRRLFEDAHDAIWLHDLQGGIIAANKSCVSLTGYSLEELRKLNADSLLGKEFALVNRLRDPGLREETIGRISEVTLVKKDGSRASVQLSTSPVSSNSHVEAFQCIARDVTEEKMMRENLSFYLQQVTRAQEEERKRIARELHDETIQALVVLSRQLDDMASRGENLSEQEKQVLERLWQQTNSIMEGLRRLS